MTLPGSTAWLCIRPRLDRKAEPLTDNAQHDALQGIAGGGKNDGVKNRNILKVRNEGEKLCLSEREDWSQ